VFFPALHDALPIFWLCRVNIANAAVLNPRSGNRYPVKRIPLALPLYIAGNKNDCRPKQVQFQSLVHVRYETGYETSHPVIQSGVDAAGLLLNFVHSDDQSSPSDQDKAGSAPEKSVNIVVPTTLKVIPSYPVPYVHLGHLTIILFLYWIMLSP